MSGSPDRVYPAAMSARLADVTGTVTTTMAGVLLAALSVPAFGATRTVVGSFALFLFANAFVLIRGVFTREHSPEAPSNKGP